MKIDCPLSAVAIGLTVLTVGCQSIDSSIFGGSFGRNSSAMVGGGAVAGQDYVIGLKPSEAAQQYFASASLSSEGEPVTVTPGDDKGTGVVWTDDGGIVIPPGTTIVFTNKGCCLDPHLPAPKADEEMQFIKTSCLIPTQLQGTYKNLLRRAAAGDEDVKANIQHLMWTLRTAGSNDAYAKNLTDRQREILAECAEAGSFDGYCQDLHRFDWLKKLVKEQVSQVADQLQIEVGNVTYKASDLLDPEIGKQKVSAHLGELIHMNEYLPVVQSGFNYGELEKGIYTDIKGNDTLSFKAKVANSTSESFVFYPMDYVAQVGSGQNMQGAFFAAADSTMRQRPTTTMPSLLQVLMDVLNQMLGSGLPEEWDSLSCDMKRKLLKNGRLAADAYNSLGSYNRDGFSGVTTDAIGGKEFADKWVEVHKRFRETAQQEEGLATALYIDDKGVLTLAFRGTEPSDISDVMEDIALVAGGNAPQVRYAREIVSLINSLPNVSRFNIVGHSLGGYLAVASALGQSEKVGAIYTYNAPGLDSGILRRYPDSNGQVAAKTVNLWHSADAIHLANESFDGGASDMTGDRHIGKRVALSGYAGLGDRWGQVWRALVPFGFTYDHSITTLNARMEANMGGCAY